MTDYTARTASAPAADAAGPNVAVLSEISAFDAAASLAPPMVMFGKIVPMHGEAIDDGVLYLRQGARYQPCGSGVIRRRRASRARRASRPAA